MTERRVYLDWNAAAPVCEAARRAMIEAMDAVGNPSSVHEHGRGAKRIIDEARDNVAALAGCRPSEVVFTSGATEAANWVLRFGGWSGIFVAPSEHDAVLNAAEYSNADLLTIAIGRSGEVDRAALGSFMRLKGDSKSLLCVQAANSETGVMQDIPALAAEARSLGMQVLVDAVQTIGKFESDAPLFDFSASGASFALVASEKLGGPAGVGALLLRDGYELAPMVVGGGQEMRRRSGTENVIGIAGFGAAARFALEQRDHAAAAEMIASTRSILQMVARDFVDLGAGARRLGNTLCFAIPGWKGATQVMQLDLAGYAVSSGSACSSGKIGESRTVRTMGHDRITAGSTLRVSIGPETREEDLGGFIDAWSGLYRQRIEKRRMA